jgi:cellulose synthase/poly-beta-1,6-N-acetylglucosamine synthase-like glycosyltransferase
MHGITSYVFLVTIAFSIISFSYYLINSISSLKLKDNKKRIENYTYQDVTIMVPVYNENEKIFRNCIKSLASQKSKLLVIGDSSLEPYKTITEEYGGNFIHQHEHKGKRGTISNGMLHVKTKFVMFVDSDTSVPDGAVTSMLSKFENNVGGVGTAVSAEIKKSSRISYCSEFFEKLKEVMFRSMLMYGSVMVLDGRCAMYRTDLVKDFMLSDTYINNRIFGRKSILAEDRHLTSYIINSGYKAVIDYNVTVVTVPQKNLKLMFKQMVRWSRAGYFYFFNELFNGAYFKRGIFYSFEMTYMYLFPIALIFLGLMRLNLIFMHGIGNYIAFEARHTVSLLSLNFAALGHNFFLYTMVQALVILGLALFGIAIASRIAKGRKLRTLVYGIATLLMMLVASMYGLFTIWKQNEWMTR